MFVAALALGVAGIACSAEDPDIDGDDGVEVPEETPRAQAGGPDDAAFLEHGPYEVGITTLQLPDRRVEVFYPAADGSSASRPKATFDIRDALPEESAGSVPEGVVIPVEVEGYRELPVSAEGPFPVVLLSHGVGGWRTVGSTLATEIASWGFVVTSADYLERGLVTVARQGFRFDPLGTGDFGEATMAASLDLVLEQGRPGGALAGAVDPERVAAVGHSTGGGTALLLASTDERVDAVVSWAASGPLDLGPKPTMIIAAEGDVVTANLASDILSFTGPTRVVTLFDSGHSVFIDLCPGIETPDGVVGRARAAGIPLSDPSISYVVDGCQDGDLPVTDAWPTILHFTVAHLRDAFGMGEPGTGLGPGVVDNLPAEVTYEQLNVE